jgi:hypothetical protein
LGGGCTRGVVPLRTGVEKHLRFFFRAIENVQRVTGFLKMPGHASAHDASADESDREWSGHNCDSTSGGEMRNSLEIQELRRNTRDTFFHVR